MNWKDHLKPQERDLLQDLEMERLFAVSERRRIYDRCRQRAKRKAEKELSTPHSARGR